jgi:hypothetical protein
VIGVPAERAVAGVTIIGTDSVHDVAHHVTHPVMP